MLGLSQHAGHLLISCPCQQVLPSARSYPYTCTTSTLASCLRTRNTGHVCEWLTTCDFRQHISSHLLCLSFLQARYGDFNIYQLSGQRCLWRLWSASYLYEQRCATQHHGVQRVWIKLGSPQSWAALDVNPKTTYHIPKMMNVLDSQCMHIQIYHVPWLQQKKWPDLKRVSKAQVGWATVSIFATSCMKKYTCPSACHHCMFDDLDTYSFFKRIEQNHRRFPSEYEKEGSRE